MNEANYPPPRGGVGDILNPATVAVLGASSTRGTTADRPIENLLRFGFQGRIFPVNPRAQTIRGLPCYRSVGEIPAQVDLALIMLPAAKVEAAIAECALAGVRTALIYAGGFAETGPEGLAAQQRIEAIARSSGMRLVGPNSQGAADYRTRTVSSFSSVLQVGDLPSGSIAVAAQSGIIAALMYDRLRSMGSGLHSSIGTGNEADIDVADCIAHFATTPGVRAICTYVEAIKDFGRFSAAIAAAHSSGIPVVAVLPGGTQAARKAVTTHTGSLAGERGILTAAIRDLNIIPAASVDELVDISNLLAQTPDGKGGKRFAIITNSGGMGVMLTDALCARGLELAELSEKTLKGLSEIMPGYICASNPIDAAAALRDPQFLEAAIELLEQDGGVDIVIPFIGMVQAGTGYPINEIVATLTAAKERSRLTVVALWQSSSAEAALELRRRGVVLFETMATCVNSLAAKVAWERGRMEFRHVSPSFPPKGEPGANLTGGQSMDILRDWGLPCVEAHRVASEQEAGKLALRGNYAIKIENPQIAHKSDIGGVLLNVPAEKVPAEAAAMLARFADHPGTSGVEIQRMAPTDGVEMIVGAVCDPVTGWAVMVGMGGLHAEVLRDISFALAPITAEKAGSMLRDLRGWPLLAGARGRPPLDTIALAEFVARFSEAVAASEDLRAIEVNPVLVYPSGAIAVDGLATINESPS